MNIKHPNSSLIIRDDKLEVVVGVSVGVKGAAGLGVTSGNEWYLG